MSNKYGVELKIDVTKIDKNRLFQGNKGKYLTMTVFLDTDNQDEYGNNGMITHKKVEGEERAPILGNAKVFWSGTSQPRQQVPKQQQPQPGMASAMDDFDDDIPFSNYELKMII